MEAKTRRNLTLPPLDVSQTSALTCLILDDPTNSRFQNDHTKIYTNIFPSQWSQQKQVTKGRSNHSPTQVTNSETTPLIQRSTKPIFQILDEISTATKIQDVLYFRIRESCLIHVVIVDVFRVFLVPCPLNSSTSHSKFIGLSLGQRNGLKAQVINNNHPMEAWKKS